ncbi:ATP-binding protein [Candidatus Parabeggiatoa sp. HSG14]|uniref:ATP-binding protein n=1 Tax=Candidatus Parabeggiatoa sp. HSG14 TaxID=3055593 RepID=UPI0025A82783|nr:ATP-binding protein [Thiotrichales bacterium HSG14]
MSFPKNPYIIDNPVSDNNAFIGRSNILHEVYRVLEHPKNNVIVLYGQRLVGKTSILQYLTAQLPNQGNYCPVYFDLQDKATLPLGQVITELAQRIASALNQTPPDLEEQPDTFFQETWLPNVLQNLPKETALVLLFDEFDELTLPQPEQAGESLFPYLRQFLDSNLKNLNFVFAIGRHADDLDNMAVSLFRGIPPIKHLSLLNQENTKKLVRLSETNHSLNWPDEAVESVWRYTQGHPFLIQQVCFHVWAQAYEKTPKTIPNVIPADVENVVFDVLDASRNRLEWLWKGLPPAERVVVSALAEAGSQHKISEQTLEKWLYESGVRVVIRELQNAPRLLQDWDFLEAIEGGYQFRVELLRRWIKENKPLRRVQDDLDRVDPVANNFFKTALDLHKGGQLKEAIPKLRETIGLNPNHLAAHQLLADILLAQGQAREAKELLEKLYNYQPIAAAIRSRLIQALLEVAQQTKNEPQQLSLYEQVLSLEPNHPEASAKSRELWQQRGDIALAKNDLKTALEIYQNLGLNKKVTELEQQIRDRFFNLTKTLKQRKKEKHRYYAGFFMLLLISLGTVGWFYQGQLKHFSQQMLGPVESIAQFGQTKQQLEQATGKIVQLEQLLISQQQLEQADGKIEQLKKSLKQANRKVAQLEKSLEQARAEIVPLKEELIKLSPRIGLKKFISQLEKGDQAVIVGSYNKQQDAEQQLKKLKTLLPELFYAQTELLPNQSSSNIYQADNIWEIFISGFYSYKSAKVLKKRVLRFEQIEDAFIRRNPFLEEEQL